MRTPEEEITELRAAVASLESQLSIIKRNLQITSISDQELDECKSRIDGLEDQISLLKHINDRKGITTNPDYPPYIPYISSVPVNREYSPSGYQSCPSQQHKY